MFVRRGPLRHARMLVALTYAAEELHRRPVEPEPVQSVDALRDLGPELRPGTPEPAGVAIQPADPR